jgi:hypothetical protein
MGTITTNPGVSALSLLTAPGAPLSRVSSLIPQSVLNSASPTDLASLSAEAAALSEVNSLFAATTPDLFQSTDLLQSSNPTLSLLDAAYGLTPTSTATPANLNGTTASPTLDQSLLSLFGTGTSNSGNLINTIG